MRRRLMVFLSWLLLNLSILGVSFLFRQTVASDWKKGPLIDPASPYAPENAALLFGASAILFFHAYFGGLWMLRGRRWAPMLALLLGVGASEAGIRLYLAYDMVTYFRPHPTLQWVVRPNLQKFSNLKGGGQITTNGDGMREVTVPREKKEGEYRVLVLGDSSNFGHGVEGTEMWSAQLQQQLPRLTVLNGACPGWTTAEAIPFLRDVGLSYHPDLVIAGFNNDPALEYLSDSARIPEGWTAWMNGMLFRSESYLLTREVTLSLVRRAAGGKSVRKAGEEPLYGALSEEETKGLVPRVPLADFLQNLQTLKQMSPDFVWINMPINRTEPEFVSRYVNVAYRDAVVRLAEEKTLRVVDVDARWRRSREPDLFQTAHVFHPNVMGHLRIAQQLVSELFDPNAAIGGPPPAARIHTLRFGISSLTPVHAHVAAVLTEHPELAEQHGIDLELHLYESGKQQGEDVANRLLDAWFSCEVPAVRMMQSRPDARIIATPGILGRIAVVGYGEGMAGLVAKKLGVSRGSTPDMDWFDWSRGMNVETVDLKTETQWDALQAGTVDALAGWDPWVEDWGRRDGKLRILVQRAFRSELSVGVLWAADGLENARHLQELVEAALKIASSDRPHYDAVVAKMSGWPLEVVKAVADQNQLLRGEAGSMVLGEADRQGIDRAARWAGVGNGNAFFGPELLDGKLPPPTVLPVQGSQFPKGPPGDPSKGPKGPPGPPNGPNPGPPGPPPPAPSGGLIGAPAATQGAPR